jgi:hypothetical protein
VFVVVVTYPAPTLGQTTTPASAVVIPAPNLSVCDFWLCCYTVGIFLLPSYPVPSGSAAVGRSCDTFFFPVRRVSQKNSTKQQPAPVAPGTSRKHIIHVVCLYHGLHSSNCFVHSNPPSQATQCPHRSNSKSLRPPFNNTSSKLSPPLWPACRSPRRRRRPSTSMRLQ